MIDADDAAVAADVAPPRSVVPASTADARRPRAAARTRGRPHPAHRTPRPGHRHQPHAPAAGLSALTACARWRPPSRSRSPSIRECPRNRAAHSRRGDVRLQLGGARQLRQTLARQHQRSGPGLLDGRRPGDRGLDRVARPPERQVRDQPQAVQVLDRLVRGAVLAQPDRVVGVDEQDTRGASAPPCAPHCARSRRRSERCRRRG